MLDRDDPCHAASTLLDCLHHRQNSGLDGFGQIRPSGDDRGEVGGGTGEPCGQSAKKRAELVWQFAVSAAVFGRCINLNAVFLAAGGPFDLRRA